MPELPEVETVCRGLNSSVKGAVIEKVTLNRDNLRYPFPDNFKHFLQGCRINNISRRAKYIIMELEDNKILLSHLGMSGKFFTKTPGEYKKHDHVVFSLNNKMDLIYNDPRRFGMMDITTKAELNQHKLIAELGVEPLTDAFNGKKLYDLIHKRTQEIKKVIMDASLVVGVGNIYASEALFRSGISPTRKAVDVTLDECIKLADNIKIILNEAIISGGSTLRDYVNASGEKGYFQHSFKVYGRENQSCIICNNSIKRINQGGRSSFYCSTCQH